MTELQYRTLRSTVLFSLRYFFHKKKFIEVETPSLTSSLIPERHIDVFSVKDKTSVKYLIPSPERHIKMLIVQLQTDKNFHKHRGVFEIAHSFRKNEEENSLHRKEFVMLEWYEIGKTIEEVKQTCLDLLLFIANRVKQVTYTKTKELKKMLKHSKNMSMKEIFYKHTNINLEDLVHSKTDEELRKILNTKTKLHQDWEDVFTSLFVEKVEPSLKEEGLCFLTHYPSCVSTLATNYYSTPQWAQRWELYVRGIELANCYCEERDKTQIKKFFIDQYHQKKYKVKGEREQLIPYPKEFFEGETMISCSGVALGVDRLVSLLCEDQQFFGIEV